MNEFLARQFAILYSSVSDYREGVLSLNSLIQRIEGISYVLDIKSWSDRVFPIVSVMKEINAFAIDTENELTEINKTDIANLLVELEAVIKYFEAM